MITKDDQMPRCGPRSLATNAADISLVNCSNATRSEEMHEAFFLPECSCTGKTCAIHTMGSFTYCMSLSSHGVF